MHVMDFLPPLGARVGDHPKTTLGVRPCAFLHRELGREHQQTPQQAGMFWSHMGHGHNVLLGDDEEMNGRPRVDVVKREQFVVFVNFTGRDLARHDFAKNAVGVACVLPRVRRYVKNDEQWGLRLAPA